jgi:membrane-associated protease RseP (regulator of RpoE activity)
MKLIPILRREESKIVLRAIPKPPVKPSNTLINWILLLATVGTTFITGYMMSSGVIDPYIGGASFTLTLLAILGAHEMGHKITANKKGIDATMPYFIPGPPPFGTFGAVIMQKSLPANRDALFDVGADGPIPGFIVATVACIVGIMLSIPSKLAPGEGTPVGVPVLWAYVLEPLFRILNIMPKLGEGEVLLLHPVAFAGLIGIFVTFLNLLPVAMLDGGHVVRSIVSDRLRIILSVVSIAALIYVNALLMAFLVLLMSLYKHPGPLDDVSSLSVRRKLVAIGLIGVGILCFFVTPIL